MYHIYIYIYNILINNEIYIIIYNIVIINRNRTFAVVESTYVSFRRKRLDIIKISNHQYRI